MDALIKTIRPNKPADAKVETRPAELDPSEFLAAAVRADQHAPVARQKARTAAARNSEGSSSAGRVSTLASAGLLGRIVLIRAFLSTSLRSTPLGPECHRADGAVLPPRRLGPHLLTLLPQNWFPNWPWEWHGRTVFPLTAIHPVRTVETLPPGQLALDHDIASHANDIYNKKIIELAGNIPRLGRLPDPDATATAHSKLCGSTVKSTSRWTGVVTDFAHDVKACALGQASSSIMASMSSAPAPTNCARCATPC